MIVTNFVMLICVKIFGQYLVFWSIIGKYLVFENLSHSVSDKLIVKMKGVT